ncbi:MAG: flagellar type III secretion system protein FliR [Clostridiales bacterium]|jgi:flagellar biosynthetic protein FliR|nr:flagellar type III secretion system protein FliR [Clostridiales bacterium]
MDETLNNLVMNFDYFILLTVRVGALLMVSPIFGRANIPNVAKIGLCLFTAYILFAALPMGPAVSIRSAIDYALLIIKELLFGLVLGYVTRLFFTLAQTAGYVIDMQMGFGMVNVFDVQNNVSVPITGNFLFIVLTMMFFAVNAHHHLFTVLFSTFRTVPVGHVTLSPQIGEAALKVFISAFFIAILVAMPFIASGLLGEMILGFIVRTTPQMNVFVVGIPLKVLLGFVVIWLVLPTYVRFTSTIFNEMFIAMEYMLENLVSSA